MCCVAATLCNPLLQVEWKYYHRIASRVEFLIKLYLVVLFGGLVLAAIAIVVAQQIMCLIHHVAPVATLLPKAKLPPPPTAPVQLAPPSTAPVQRALPPAIRGGSASVHADVPSRPTTSHPTPVDASDSSTGIRPLLTPSPLDPPNAAVDGDSSQAAASHQHMSWRELVTATIRRRGVKAAQD
jgi:hypothetical protein